MIVIINSRSYLNIKTYNSPITAVVIETGYWLHDRGVVVQAPVGSRIFTSPCRPDQL
jgi:hypothetical protein